MTLRDSGAGGGRGGTRQRRLPAKYRDMAFATLTSAGMSVIINLVIAGANYLMGQRGSFATTFLSGAVIGFVIGVPAALWLVPRVAQIVDRIVEPGE